MQRLTNRQSRTPTMLVRALLLAAVVLAAWVSGQASAASSGNHESAQAAPPSGTYEESSAAVTLTGAWNRVSDPSASGGGYVASNTAGASISFTFSGDSLVIYRRVDTDG